MYVCCVRRKSMDVCSVGVFFKNYIYVCAYNIPLYVCMYVFMCIFVLYFSCLLGEHGKSTKKSATRSPRKLRRS